MKGTAGHDVENRAFSSSFTITGTFVKRLMADALKTVPFVTGEKNR